MNVQQSNKCDRPSTCCWQAGGSTFIPAKNTGQVIYVAQLRAKPLESDGSSQAAVNKMCFIHLQPPQYVRSTESCVITRSRNRDVSFSSSVQISGQTLGGIVFTIKVMQCLVRSKGSCSMVKELPFMMEACSPATCPNSSRLSFSLDQLQELTSTSWDLECSISVCHSKVPTASSGCASPRIVSFLFYFCGC